MSAPPVGCVLPWLSSSPRGDPLPWALTRSLSAQMAKKTNKPNLSTRSHMTTTPGMGTDAWRNTWQEERKKERRRIKTAEWQKKKGKSEGVRGKGKKVVLPFECFMPAADASLLHTRPLCPPVHTTQLPLSLSLLSPFHSVPWLTPLACWTVAKVV